MIDDQGTLIIADAIDIDDVDEVIDCTGITVLPGLMDTHVHLRSPGFEYKEAMKSGTMAAAHGGVTTVFAMPNLKPAPDTLEHLQVELDAIEKDAVVHVIPMAAITEGQKPYTPVADIEGLSKETFIFSDDGVGVQKEEVMREAMQRVAKCNGVIVAHCEDNEELKPGGCVHEGILCDKYGLVGINSASEYNQVKRDLKLAEETGCQYHICHISTKESVQALREAKARGVNCSGEVTVHHLLLNEEDVSENHGRFKMNPPLRSKEDQATLIEAIQDGTIEIICTDQAPHSLEEKDTTMDKASMGIVSIEYSFLLVYTYLVMKKVISLEKAIELMSYNAADIFGVNGGEIVNFEKANLALFDLNRPNRVDVKKFYSKGKSTPFENWRLQGECVMTIVDGEIVYRNNI